MGIKLFGNSYGRTNECKPTDTINTIAPNPDPYRFEIIQQEVVNGKSILVVKYDGCTTFSGHKLLLLKREWIGGTKLDPHLLGDKHIVLARFEPTEEGLTLARICAAQ